MFLNGLPPFYGMFPQQGNFIPEHRVGADRYGPRPLGKVPEDPQKELFRVIEVVKLPVPFYKVGIFYEVPQKHTQDSVNKIHIGQGFIQKNIRVRVQDEQIPDHPYPGIEDEDIVFEIDLLTHIYM
jgi:hypothetical protein